MNTTLVAAILGLASALAANPQIPEECTSAIVSPGASASGAPILWKSRDTGNLSNKVVFVRETPFCYLGLADADVGSGRHVFAGLNSAGFGIINTVAYNLPKRGGEMFDLEGVMMADALRTCRTVEDFECYLRAGLGSKLGSQANFGVIDAGGQAVVFEVHNHGFEKLDAGAADDGYLINTNFSRSGPADEGQGYLRFERASRLFAEFDPGGVDFATILSRHTRDLGHALLEQPGLTEAREAPADRDLWIDTRDCIDRPSTAAAVVIVGRDPDDPDSVATMWIIPGEPVTAVAVPLWVEAGASPAPLWDGEEAPMWRESLRIKRFVRPHTEGHKRDYLNLTRLENADGTGFLPRILAAENAILAETREFLADRHTAAEFAAFQVAMAERALGVLRTIR